MPGAPADRGVARLPANARVGAAVLAWCIGTLLALLAHGCTSAASDLSSDQLGTIVLKKQPHGEYVQYLPRSAPKGILPVRPAHVGTTRVAYARQWLDAMTPLAPPGRSRSG